LNESSVWLIGIGELSESRPHSASNSRCATMSFTPMSPPRLQSIVALAPQCRTWLMFGVSIPRSRFELSSKPE
jgi:hypothetical protein